MDFPSGETAEQMALFDTAKGDRYKQDAKDWIRRNHGVWLFFCNYASKCATEKKHFSIDQLAIIARYELPTEGDGDFKMNNNLRAPLARMLREAVPQCREYLQIRDSVCDL